MVNFKLALISRHIVLHHSRYPLYGLILIEDELIKEVVVVDKSIPVSALFDKYRDWNPVDYEHFYISPGIIDCNVRVNGDWDGYRHLTKAALSGGVTMLLEEPSLYDLRCRDSELFCDVARSFLADNNNLLELDSALSDGVLAVKGYLSTPSAYIDSVDAVLPELLDRLARARVPLLLDVCYPSRRHIHMGSPCRYQTLKERAEYNCTSDSQFFAGAYPDDDRSSSGEKVTREESIDETQSDLSKSQPGRISGTFQTRASTNAKIAIQVIDEDEEFEHPQLIRKTLSIQRKRKRRFSTSKLHNIYQDLDKRIQKVAESIKDLADVEYQDYQHAGKTVFGEIQRRRSNSYSCSPNSPSSESQTAIEQTPVLIPDLFLHVKTDCQSKGIRPSALAIHKISEEKEDEDWKDRSYLHHLANFPDRWERNGVDYLAEFLKKSLCRVHICNLASANAVNKVRKLSSPFVTCETCAHYLYFTSDMVKDGCTIFKTYPPIRNQANNRLLWDLLKMKAVDMIVSNHTPVLPDYKFLETGNFRKALNGVSGLGFTLQTVWTRLLEQGGTEEQLDHYIVRLSTWLSLSPAELLGISHVRGAIDTGKFADLIVWQPMESYRVSTVHSPHRLMCPYLGEQLNGKVHKVYIRGYLSFDEGTMFSHGRRIYRSQFP